MKNLKYLILTLALAVFNISCENDGGTSAIQLNDGAVPNMVKSVSSAGFFDLVKVDSGENVSVTFSADVAQGKPASIDIVGIYTTSAGMVYSATLFGNVSLPQDFNLSINDIVAAFSELNSSADISVGDAIALTTRFTMADGTILNILNDDGTSGTGTNIQTTVLFTTVITYPVSCPSDLGGTHSYVSSNLQAAFGAGCPTGDVTGTVTFTDQGGGIYLVSDLGFGQYGSSCWNDTPATSGGAIITEVCGKLISGGADQYGLTYNWVITSVSGDKLSISWSNNYGDSGDVVITREGGVDWPPLFTE
tara:strand:- start:22479 stop:23396 length:918 start_codon:yes stop_codon:yes gene_type:complete